MMETENRSFFCSWSGGKDSCLSLYRAVQKGLEPQALLTMLTEGGKRSRSHGLPVSLLEKQGLSLGIPLTVCSASWSSYEERFLDIIAKFRGEGLKCGVFGDIDIEDHRLWVERVCMDAGIEPYHPLWKESRRSLLTEFIELGFKAYIISVKDGVLDRSFLGKALDKDLVSKIESLGVDASGEEGELHTVVADGPGFAFPLNLEFKDQFLRDGYWFQDVACTE